MKIGKEYQKRALLFFREKFLIIPIHNSKCIPYLPNATLSNDGNVQGITL